MTDLKKISVLELPLVGPAYAKKLKKLEIESIWDLFHHVPTRFLDFSKNTTISNLQMDEIATVHGKVTSFVNTYTRNGKAMQIVTIADTTGKIEAMWFNQIYLARTFKEGMEVSLAGKLTWIGRKRAIIAPEYEIMNANGPQIHTGHLIPIYAETAGISSKWIRRKIYDAWKRYKDDFEEFLPEEIVIKNNLVSFKEAIEGVHFPKNMEQFEKAKWRLAFNELLALHTQNLKNKKKWMKNRIKNKFEIPSVKPKIDTFIGSLPFKLTNSQQKVANEILTDLGKDVPMNRLLEGDVGSGKTVVAAISMYAVYLSGKKSVLMAPTQILANQHFETLKKIFSNLEINIRLDTSARSITNGKETDIFVGTHSLLSKNIDMKDVAFIVIDEQHKFGVEQRNLLVKKTGVPHVLTMTATPIPRTVALTFFGDLDLSTLDEMPKGRQKIKTWLVPEVKRKSGFEWIEKEIKKEGIQAFVVCPLIDPSSEETMAEVKAANHEYEILQDKFKSLKFGLLHGKMKTKEKDEVIAKFRDGKINVLVSTPVVEVGVDIPNATIMVIEGADRFGLASLHQLRGRVGRGSKKSYCLLMTENLSDKTQVRLNAMTKYVSGFELAEIDLALRGPGEIYGDKQSGIPELKIADWNDLDLIRTTREVSITISSSHQ